MRGTAACEGAPGAVQGALGELGRCVQGAQAAVCLWRHHAHGPGWPTWPLPIPPKVRMGRGSSGYSEACASLFKPHADSRSETACRREGMQMLHAVQLHTLEPLFGDYHRCSPAVVADPPASLGCSVCSSRRADTSCIHGSCRRGVGLSTMIMSRCSETAVAMQHDYVAVLSAQALTC